jgi:hypothetical protein
MLPVQSPAGREKTPKVGGSSVDAPSLGPFDSHFRRISPASLRAEPRYDRPKSMHVVDIAVMTLHGTIASTDIHLRLMPGDK